MIKKILREIYLLPRGEQRAMILLSLFLILSLGVRILVQILPERTPPGMVQFVQESRAIMAAIQQADSLKRGKNQYPGSTETYRSTNSIRVYSYRTPVTGQRSPIKINTADSMQLLPLPGIGPVFAGRIVKYRNLLGGFVFTDQLREVYGLTEETLNLIIERIVLDTSEVQKMAINSAAFRDLLRHPYLKLEDVKSLVQYRDFKGKISSLQELMDNDILSDSILQKVSPYFHYGL